MSTDMSDDEKFDTWLQSEAQGYNRPPEAVPRDAMWAAIEAAATQRALDTVMPIRRPRIVPRYWQAAAAAVILAAGIGIGRIWSSTSGSGAAPGVASAPNAAGAPQLAAADTGAFQSAGGVRATGGASLLGEGAGNDVYDVAAVQHLSRAEALLTSFRSSGSGETANSMNVWARDLLGDTRLLLDSPAATDARRRHLLEDLELVLAQIVQLPAESSADRSLVQRSIERGSMLSRLRSTIPAGFTSGT